MPTSWQGFEWEYKLQGPGLFIKILVVKPDKCMIIFMFLFIKKVVIKKEEKEKEEFQWVEIKA